MLLPSLFALLLLFCHASADKYIDDQRRTDALLVTDDLIRAVNYDNKEFGNKFLVSSSCIYNDNFSYHTKKNNNRMPLGDAKCSFTLLAKDMITKVPHSIVISTVASVAKAHSYDFDVKCDDTKARAGVTCSISMRFSLMKKMLHDAAEICIESTNAYSNDPGIRTACKPRDTKKWYRGGAVCTYDFRLLTTHPKKSKKIVYQISKLFHEMTEKAGVDSSISCKFNEKKKVVKSQLPGQIHCDFMFKPRKTTMRSFVAFLLASAVLIKISAAEKVPSIVVWTEFFGAEKLHIFLNNRLKEENCPKECIIVPRSRMTTEADFDAVIFHSRDVDIDDLPPSRNQDQLYFILTMEAPGNRNEGYLEKFPPNFFNGTISYSHLNNYTYDYDRPAAPDLSLLVRNKNESVLGVISNCYSESGREDAIDRLQEHIRLTLHGDCYNGRVSDEEIERLIKSHRFILALENKICPDYVSEKAFRYKELIVPIVFSRRFAENVLPADSFIAIDDFNSTEELGRHLERLQRDDGEYVKYFAWTKRAEHRELRSKTGLCKLCTDLHTSPRPRHPPLLHAVFPDENLCIIHPRRWRIALPKWLATEIPIVVLIVVLSTIGARLVFVTYRRFFRHCHCYELVR